jgi:AcrR family transcriptional regulator
MRASRVCDPDRVSADGDGLSAKRGAAGVAIGTSIISKEGAVRTALKMIDEGGLSSFSIERLAREIGVRGPSLYKHFKDRDDLLSAVARLVLLEVPAPRRRPGRTWDEQMLDLALALRGAVLGHPHAGPLLLQYLPRQLMIEPYDTLVRSLREADIPDRYHVLILEGCPGLVSQPRSSSWRLCGMVSTWTSTVCVAGLPLMRSDPTTGLSTDDDGRPLNGSRRRHSGVI